MIRQISRGFILVEVDGHVARVPGEMFFLPQDRIGFTVFNDQFLFWDPETQRREVTTHDREKIFEDIKLEFEKGGHFLEIA